MEDKKFWDNYARRRREPQHEVVRAFVDGKIETLRSIIPDYDQYSLLDVGCGNGRFLAHFQTPEKVGIDYSVEMIQEASTYLGRSNLEVANGYNLPFPDESFGIVFGGCYLHNLSDDTKALREMKRVAREYIILVEPNPLNPLMALFNIISGEEEIGSVFKFRKGYYKRIFESNGLNVKCLTRGHITPNRTPPFLLPILKVLENISFLHFTGLYYIIVSKKV